MSDFLEKSGLVRAVLDAMPLPVFVLDRELRILDSNDAGAKFLEGAGADQAPRRPGDMLRCLVAIASPGGCGTGDPCKSCVLRGAIVASIAQGVPVRRRGTLERLGARGPQKLHFFVTAAEIPAAGPPLHLLVFEDVTEFAELRGLVPICASCKKIRNDRDYWEQVEHYLGRHLEMNFTHGMCPECLERYYPEGSIGRKAPAPPLTADREPG